MTGEEIIAYRTALNITQQELAELIGVSKNTIYNYEKGTKIPDSKIPIFENLFKNQSQKIVSDSNAVKVSYSEMNVMMVPLISTYAQAGYLSGFNDPEYIEELPKIPFADDKEHRGDYLCFEVKGDSMEDGSLESILEGDLLLCRNVRQDFWKSKLHINKWDFVIVHREKGILVKRIIKHDVENGILTLHSLNDYYEDFTINLKDVAKIMNVVDIKRKHKRR